MPQQLLEKEGRGQVTCPNCRQVQQVKGNAQSLPIDPVRNKLVDYVQFKKGKNIPCTGCPDGSNAVVRCHECKIYMCTRCKEAHHRNMMTRKHTCQSMDEALSEPVKTFLRHFCKDHPDHKIEFYCRQCSSLCCVSCSIVRHKGHDLDSIEDAANSMLLSLKTKMEDVEKSASVLRRKTTSLHLETTTQKDKLSQTTDLINQTFDVLIGKLNCQRNKLNKKLNERIESRVKGLEKQREAIEDNLAQMESTLEYFKQMESKSDDCEVLSAGPVLVQSLEAAAAVDQTQCVQHPTSTLSQGEINNIISKVYTFGEIIFSTEQSLGEVQAKRVHGTASLYKAGMHHPVPAEKVALKERSNVRLEAVLEEAVDQLQRLTETGRQGFKSKLGQTQHEEKTTREKDEKKTLEQPSSNDEFELRCFGCDTHAFSSKDIRVVANSFHLVVADISHLVFEVEPERKDVFQGMQKVSDVHCNACQARWGSGVMYKGVKYVYISIVNFMAFDKTNRSFHWTKWKNAHFKCRDLERT